MFYLILTGVGTLLHFYCTWRIGQLAYGRLGFGPWWIGAGGIWLIWLAGFKVGNNSPGTLLSALTSFSFTWIAVLFLTTLCLLTTDLLTGFGTLFKDHLRFLHTTALITAGLLIVLAMIQGMRSPVITNYQVSLDNLPTEMNGLVIVALSDLHLGAQLDSQWLNRRIDQVESLKPDLILLLGDLVEGNPHAIPGLANTLTRLHAPLGVWAVTGNHEFYGDIDATIQIFESAGIRWLRNQSVLVAPGLMLTGREDNHHTKLPTPLSQVLPNRPKHAVSILLSHRPEQAKQAADGGIDLMLSGHTHNGQIWPFTLLVRRRYPYLAGQYTIGPMTLFVCRGTGTWGPRMRLWKPAEILNITLHHSDPTRPPPIVSYFTSQAIWSTKNEAAAVD